MSELLGIRMRYELSFGSSRNEDRGLNAFISSWHVGMAPPAEEAWFVLNISPPVYSRKVPMPDMWYRFNDWKSYGQRSSISEWSVSVEAAIARASAAERIAADRRIDVFLRHLPEGHGMGLSLVAIREGTRMAELVGLPRTRL